ncbi:DMT family transporter [candidate division KSB1 bacterium]|nr:DMT family transporter [candidate division KSB1 bacterium]
MSASRFQTNLLLLLAAIIWGFSFVAQRTGMNYLGPFTFNAIRFTLGGLVLLPLIGANRNLKSISGDWRQFRDLNLFLRRGLLAGSVLFFGISFQQMGIVYTTAGKAGFITGLYVIFVPILGYFVGKASHWQTWLGAGLAVVGLYFLTVTEVVSINQGDLLVLIGAFFWGIHVQVISRFSAQSPALILATHQFLTCAGLSALIALLTEHFQWHAIFAAKLPLLYSGILSVGVAFTLQVIAQRNAHPTSAAIILSLESVFAAFGGWFLLGEALTARSILGGGLILAQVEFNLTFA